VSNLDDKHAELQRIHRKLLAIDGGTASADLAAEASEALLVSVLAEAREQQDVARIAEAAGDDSTASRARMVSRKLLVLVAVLEWMTKHPEATDDEEAEFEESFAALLAEEDDP
jgi:uncharacterized membrane protein